ncbi:MAG: hypothetical protein LLG44_12235, partial [Chloroflexi bacterium]|nr:hypothetical protein [Chloroflexota bacterium]
NLLDRIPEKRSPLIFVTELITAVILLLSTVREAPEVHALFELLEQVGLPHKYSLNVLSGIAMLLSVVGRANRRYSTIILSQVSRYEEALAQLSEESRRLVSEFTREAVHILAS